MNDTAITDDDELYRRLAPDHLSPDRSSVRRNAYRVANEYPRRISVDLARLTASPEAALRSRPTFGLGALRVADVRALGFVVRADPLPENPAHCLIEGENSREMADHLARITRIVILPHV